MMTKRLSSIAEHRPACAGFGLIELMVALTIGLFIALALTSVFLSSKSAFESQNQLAQLQDSERLALSFLVSSIEMAGYFPDPRSSTRADKLPAAALDEYATFAAGQAIVGASIQPAVGGSIEVMATRFVSTGGDGLVNCNAGVNPTVGAARMFTNIFSIGPNKELLCAVDANPPVALVSNVASFHVLYGVDTSSSHSASQYLSANEVTRLGFWSNVMSAQITLNFVNPYAAQPGQPPTIKWVQTVSLMNNL